MKFVTAEKDSGSYLGLLIRDRVVDVQVALAEIGSDCGSRGRFDDATDVFRVAGALEALSRASLHLERMRQRGGSDEARARQLGRELAELKLLPPVLRPSKVIGVGMNYFSFVDQIGEQVPSYPVLFHKTSSALTGAGRPIVIPPVTEEAVPEGELAVVIGRGGAFISVAEAESHVGGYACANDVSARNLEFRTSQWTSGKMLATFCPLGPALVTPDEVVNADRLALRTVLNGRTIQEGNTSGMIFGIARLISEISSLVTLEVGDVILTGTPSDLGAVSAPVFLAHGDTLRVEIEGVGALENIVVAASRARSSESGRVRATKRP